MFLITLWIADNKKGGPKAACPKISAVIPAQAGIQ
jgi:hypothetical protein